MSSPGRLKTVTSSVAAACNRKSLVRERMSRNVHQIAAIHERTRAFISQIQRL